MLGAELQGADLRDARLGHANLAGARLEGADLTAAALVWVDLSHAAMKGARLSYAEMNKVVLRRADLRLTKWANPSIQALPAQFADLRGAEELTQGQLDQMIGNVQTLLPNVGNLSIPSCWKTPPEGFDALVDRVAEVRADFLCPAGEEPQRTGTPLAVDAPYPPGHPLADS